MKIRTLYPLRDYPELGEYEVSDEDYHLGKGGHLTHHKGAKSLVSRGLAEPAELAEATAAQEMPKQKKKSKAKPKADERPTPISAQLQKNVE